MNDRLTQLIALLVVAGALIAAVMLSPMINQQRRDRQLTYDVEVGDAANPEYTFVASLGSLRGLAVNALWYRAEQLKQQGKFYEANNLAEMITTLQPRFPQVWLFQGWNMAYNISVKTNTPEERYDWVLKGVNLLREKGIPNNPNSVTLYKELSWILSHKMGGQTDDMNNYYKREYCKEWHILLGPPQEGIRLKPQYQGMTREQVLAALGPERFNRNEHIEQVTPTTHFAQLVEFSDAYVRKPDAEDGVFGERYYFTSLNPNARDRFFADYPELGPFVEKLKQITLPNGDNAGLGLNSKTLRAYGTLSMYANAGYDLSDPRVANAEVLGSAGLALLEWNRAQSQVPDAQMPDIGPMLNLLRVQTLVSEYHMDPRFMHKCMEDFGDLDWRHVHTHAVYWSALGTRTAHDNMRQENLTRIDLINNDRATIHAVQGLVHGGKIYFQPRVAPLYRETGGLAGDGVYDQQPDTGLIPAYGIAHGFTQERIESGDFGDLSTKTYEQGYENFLQVCVVYYYFAGELEQAQDVYKQLQDKYGDSASSPVARDGEYDLPLSDFALVRLEDDLGYQGEYLIRTLIQWALRRGVANRDARLTGRLLNDAKIKYDAIMEERVGAGSHVGLNETDAQGRRALASWPEIIESEFSTFLLNPGYEMSVRSSVWQVAEPMLRSISTEVPLHFVVYRRIAEPIRQQLSAVGREPDEFFDRFPIPQGFQEYLNAIQQRAPAPEPNDAPPSIRRN